MFRFIIVSSGVVLFLILSIPLVLIELIVGVFSRKARDYSCLRIVQAVFKYYLFVTGAKITVKGEENIPAGCSVLYVCNHRSFFDILVTYSRCQNLTGYVAKKSMEKAPMLNVWMKLLYCLFLDRDNIKEGLKTIIKGSEYLKNGISVCIFPEGTRGNEEGKLLPFKEGSVKMAQKAKCPVIPVAISNTAGIWENQFPRMKPAHVILEYGKPFYIDQLENEDKKFPGAYTQRMIQEMLDKNTPMI